MCEERNNWFAEKPNHSFDDVTGMDELKTELKNDCDHAFLFYGDPGCGKTYLAEAFIHELMKSDYKYMHIQLVDFLSIYAGESEKGIKEIFETAEESAPCILFIEDIEVLCVDRNLPDLPTYKVSLTEAFAEAFNHLKDSGKELIFIAETSHPQRIDAAVSDKMKQVKVRAHHRTKVTDTGKNSMSEIRIKEAMEIYHKLQYGNTRLNEEQTETYEAAEQILQEGDPTLEEMEQMLAAKGELEELIDLSGFEELD